MTDKSGRKSNFAWKNKKRFRSRMMKVSGTVMKMGVLMEVWCCRRRRRPR